MNNSDHEWFQGPTAFDKFTGVLMILIIIISLIGNSLVCYAFIVNPRLRIVTNYFIMNLAVSDILTAALVITFDVDSRFHGFTSWKYGETMCKVWTTLYTISVPTSVLTLCVVSTDRYKAISDPLGYRTGISFSTKKALFSIAIIWAVVLVLAFLPKITGPPLNVTLDRDAPQNNTQYFCMFELSANYSTGLGITLFILPSIIMVILYGKMYRIILNRKNLTEESVMSRASSSTTVDSHAPTRSFQSHYQNKVARHFAVIIFVQLACWYPFTIESIIVNLCNTCHHLSSSMQFFLLTIGYSSCAINPYLYAYQQRSFRQVLHKMLRVKTM